VIIVPEGEAMTFTPKEIPDHKIFIEILNNADRLIEIPIKGRCS